ncbi:MAG: molecular chaperone DnaJ [archaeon]
MAKDYYDVLGVGKNASKDEIRQAYKKLAKKFHPDINKIDSNAEEKFKEANEAYKILSDDNARANYDQFGQAGDQFKGFGGFEGFRGFGSSSDFGFDFSDLFEGLKGFGFNDMFGQGMRGKPDNNGSDIQARFNVSFNEAVFGITKHIEIERIGKCEKCKGSGSEDGKQTTCDKCHGRGFIEKHQRTILGTFASRAYCNECHGEGKVIESPCESCHGQGVKKERKKVEVKIPAGVHTGSYLKLKGMGNSGPKNGSIGDLFIVLYVEPSETFKRDGFDVLTEVKISFPKAALGGEVKVPGLKDSLSLKVPAGTQTDSVFRLKGKGIKNLNSSSYGDEYVKVIIETPKKLNKKEKELLEKLFELQEGKEKKKKGWFN